MGAFCCHGNQSFNPIFPKTLRTLSPTPVMLHINLIKIGQLALEIFKFECVDDIRWTDDGPLVYYKLTLWAFGSGELIISHNIFQIIISLEKWEEKTKLRWQWKYILKILLHSRACDSKVTDPIPLEFELVRNFMPVLVTNKFDKDLIKNKCASLETPFSHY